MGLLRPVGHLFPWLHRVQGQTRLFNAAPIVHWNLDKHYLQDLEQQGVKVVPTAFIRRQSFLPLFELMAQRGWSDVVIKPAIAGAAVDTYRVTRAGEVATLSPEPPSTISSSDTSHSPSSFRMRSTLAYKGASQP